MKKTFFAVAVLSGLLLVSCNSRNNRSTNEVATVEAVDVIEPVTTTVADPMPANPVVSSTVTDNQGNTMRLAFNNNNGTATAELNGQTIYMTQDTTASGVRMHNDEYEYEEWQGHIVLKKDGKVVFDNKDEVNASISNREGRKIDMTFNNNNNTATLTYDGQVINLRADTTASGMRYSNNEYVYEEWQGHGVLKRNGTVVFDSKK